MKNYKLDIKKIDDGDLTDILENSNFKKFRKSQIKAWLFKKNVNSFEKMTNLSKELKRFLSKKFDINSLEIISSTNLLNECFGFHLSSFFALVKSPIKLSTSVSLKYFLSTLMIVFLVNLSILISFNHLLFQISLIFNFI